jgi:hypothetical protein
MSPEENDMSALILPPGKPALLVIDLQNDFLHPDGKFASGLPGRSLPEIASVTPTLSRLAGEGEEEAAAEGSLYDFHNSDTNSVSI